MTLLRAPSGESDTTDPLIGVSSLSLERGKALLLPHQERTGMFIAQSTNFTSLLALSDSELCLAHAYKMSTYLGEFTQAKNGGRPWTCDFSRETIPTTSHMMRKYGRTFLLGSMTREFAREALEHTKKGTHMEEQQLLEMQYVKSGALEFLHYMQRVAALWERQVYQNVLNLH